jgi:hypothetical protein
MRELFGKNKLRSCGRQCHIKPQARPSSASPFFCTWLWESNAILLIHSLSPFGSGDSVRIKNVFDLDPNDRRSLTRSGKSFKAFEIPGILPDRALHRQLCLGGKTKVTQQSQTHQASNSAERFDHLFQQEAMVTQGLC